VDAKQFSDSTPGGEDRHNGKDDNQRCAGDTFDNFVKGCKHDQNPLFIELCSGCGILSATINALGFDVMPVDHKHNKHRVRIKTFNLDLTEAHSWSILRYIVDQCNVIGVHLAPPCGTCSRAREIKLSDVWHGPQPLRNKEHPYGVPNMTDRDQARVDQANTLYMHMCDFCIFLNNRNVAWTMENPTNSWLWELPCMEFLVNQMFFTSFHSCAYGGKRYKATSFLTNNPVFLILCRQCDGQHEHLPWGIDEATQQFSTALEAEYPKCLCEEYAMVLTDLAKGKGLNINPYPKASDKLHPQKQQSGRSVPPLVPEYAKVVSMLLSSEPQLDSKNKLMQQLPNIPEGSKLLRTEAKGGQGDKQYVMYVFGIFHGHQNFVTIAKSLWHPFDELRHLPDLLTKSIYNVLSRSKIDIARERLATLRKWREWADELQESELSLKNDMEPHVRKVMNCKRVLLLNKLATEVLDWPDKCLFDDLCNGFRLVGEAPATGVFKTQPKVGNISEEELMKQSKFLRPAIIGKTNSASKSEHEDELYDITVKEAEEKGWLQGPMEFAEVCDLFGSQWLPVRRFCVEQRGKLRPIDDFCENRLNQAFSTVDKISLKTMDHIAWAAMIICKHSIHSHTMNFTLKSGEQLRGKVHPDWTGGCTIKSTTLDLKSAYKQLPLHKSDVNKAIVTLRDPSCGKAKHFSMCTLPFGASASVLHFNRVSVLLWALGCHLNLIWASYYDDYPILCPAGLEQSSLGAAKAMLGLLGFDYSAEKLNEPCIRNEMLGVELDLSDSDKGVVSLRNKQDRVADIRAMLDQIICEGKVKPRDLPSHLGRLQFADMQIAGRSGKLAMHDLRQLGSTEKSFVKLNGSQVSALKLLRHRVTSGEPRKLNARPNEKPWIVFTDGALEYDSTGHAQATIGGILMSPNGETYCFGSKVPDKMLDRWQTEGREHVIGLVELYACVTAIGLWKDLLKDRRILLFVDNYGAQDCMVKGSANVDTWRQLLLRLEELDDNLFSNMWISRVPSASNPADYPSRGSLGELKFLEPICKCKPTCPILGLELEAIC
jgi:hypothetical protein